jgi:integrase
VLAEIPEEWSPFFDLLASTGLRVSEAIALRWMDLELDGDPHLWVRRSVVGGVIGAPKSRFERRCIPLDADLVARLAGRGCRDAGDEDLVFSSASGTPLNPDNVRYRVLVPAVERAGLSGIGLPRLPPHLCLHADRAGTLAAAPSALDGTSLGRVYARYVRASDRRRDGAGTRSWRGAFVPLSELHRPAHSRLTAMPPRWLPSPAMLSSGVGPLIVGHHRGLKQRLQKADI